MHCGLPKKPSNLSPSFFFPWAGALTVLLWYKRFKIQTIRHSHLHENLYTEHTRSVCTCSMYILIDTYTLLCIRDRFCWCQLKYAKTKRFSFTRSTVSHLRLQFIPCLVLFSLIVYSRLVLFVHHRASIFIFIIVSVIHSNKTLQAHFILAYRNTLKSSIKSSFLVSFFHFSFFLKFTMYINDTSSLIFPLLSSFHHIVLIFGILPQHRRLSVSSCCIFFLSFMCIEVKVCSFSCKHVNRVWI